MIELLLVAALVPAAWENWAYSRPVETKTLATAALARFPLPVEVLGRSRESLADLRLIDDAGDEVPYIVHSRHGRQTRNWRSAGMSDAGFVPGEYTQVVADTGEQGKKHNSLEIDVDEADFFTWVELAASDDRETWRIVREKAPIYRFQKDELEGSRIVSYPDTTSRWLRVRVLFPDREMRVTGCRVSEEIRRKPELVTLAEGSVAADGTFTVDLGATNVPVSTVRFATEREEFHRPVRLEVSPDGEAWREVEQRETYRYRVHNEEIREKLVVHFGEARGRHVRVTVFNRNDPPIDDLRATVLGTPRYVVFRPEPGRAYRLLYGNSRVDAPEYELARLTTREESESARVVSVGAEEVNETYVSPEPWTERHPVVMWVALVAAIAVLAWLALRSLH